VPRLQFYPGTTHLHACHAVEEGRLPDLPDAEGAGALGTAPPSIEA
jgi:hypothetical protein